MSISLSNAVQSISDDLKKLNQAFDDVVLKAKDSMGFYVPVVENEKQNRKADE